MRHFRTCYAIDYPRNPLLEDEVRSGVRPCPEFLLFVNRNNATLLTHTEIAISAGEYSEILKTQGLLNWVSPNTVFTKPEKYDYVFAAAESLGIPLAAHAYNHTASARVGIITHGQLYNWFRAVRSIRDFENVWFLCLSAQIKEMMLERFPIPESQVLNTSWGIDADFFSPRDGEDLGVPLIVAAGLANRDYRTLIDAMKCIGAQLCIAAGSEWCSMKADLGPDIPPNVECRPSCNYLMMRELYARSFCVVVPLHPVPFASGYLVIAEAMAMGKPVIATRTDAFSDCIIDGETGYYVRPGSPDDLRDRIEYLIRNPALAHEMGRRARKRIEQHFSLTEYCQRLETALI